MAPLCGGAGAYPLLDRVTYPQGIEHESSFLSALAGPPQLQRLPQELPICLTKFMIFVSAELLVIALFATG